MIFGAPKMTTVIIAGAVAATAMVIYLDRLTIRSMLSDARMTAIAERDQYWRAELAILRADTEARINQQIKQTMAVEAKARDQVAEAEARAAELESANAALPDGADTGLGRDRVRLLNQR